jgi:endonuclease III
MPRPHPDSDPKRQARQVVKGLAKLYPDAACALHFRDPFELLVATILSAQCTDTRVNLVTPTLFQRFPDAAAMAKAELPELEEIIRSTGFFRAKSKNLQAMARALVEDHGGVVPEDLEEMTKLPGVGRKTANVVLGTAYGIPSGVVVDTHVKRLAYRLGIARSQDPVKVEREIAADVPRKEWINLSHRLIHHGRKICLARRPRCSSCGLLEICPRQGVTEKSPSPADSLAGQSNGRAKSGKKTPKRRSPKP